MWLRFMNWCGWYSKKQYDDKAVKYPSRQTWDERYKMGRTRGLDEGLERAILAVCDIKKYGRDHRVVEYCEDMAVTLRKEQLDLENSMYGEGND